MHSKWLTTEIAFILTCLACSATIAIAVDDCDELTQYLCSDGKTCISKRYVCNNVTDCPDRDDETDCGKRNFKCFQLLFEQANVLSLFRHEALP